MKRIILLAAAAAALAACAGGQSNRDEVISQDTEKTVEQDELRVRQTETLSALAKMEESIAAYIATEKRIPDSLDQLVPKYLAEIPSVEIDVRGHRDNNLVKVYPSSILRDGQIDGTMLKDTGRWGYVHNDRQVVVFVDCTHQARNGKAWFEQHGAY